MHQTNVTRVNVCAKLLPLIQAMKFGEFRCMASSALFTEFDCCTKSSYSSQEASLTALLLLISKTLSKSRSSLRDPKTRCFLTCWSAHIRVKTTKCQTNSDTNNDLRQHYSLSLSTVLEQNKYFSKRRMESFSRTRSTTYVKHWSMSSAHPSLFLWWCNFYADNSLDSWFGWQQALISQRNKKKTSKCAVSPSKRFSSTEGWLFGHLKVKPDIESDAWPDMRCLATETCWGKPEYHQHHK